MVWVSFNGDETLRRIQDNNITCLDHIIYPNSFADDDAVEEAGRAIMDNTSIEKLDLDGFKGTNISKYQPLFMGISQNTSIRRIYIRRSDVGEELSRVFLDKNLSELQFFHCDLTVDVVASGFLTKKKLRFCDCTFGRDKSIRSNKRAKSEPLDREVNLEKLTIDKSRLGIAVSRLLLGSRTTLKSINIRGVREQNLVHQLASALPHLTISEITLTQIQVNVDDARELSRGLSQNKTLESLRITNLAASSPEAMSIMIQTCVGPTSTLRELYLYGNDTITDTEMLMLLNLLEKNSTLNLLDLSTLSSLSSISWLALARVLGSSHCSLKALQVTVNETITDEVIIAFANELSNNESLEVLDVQGCNNVTPDGWLAFSRLLGSFRSGLKKLNVKNDGINIDVVTACANELIGNENSQLERLIMKNHFPMTNAVWDTIINLLCNTSSIDATWSSNHNLCCLGPFRYRYTDSDDDDSDFDDIENIPMPKEISDLLTMNEYEDKKQVARRKVINHHFSRDFDVNALIGLDQKLLSRKISWFGRDSLGISAVYRMIRALPELCQNDQK